MELSFEWDRDGLVKVTAPPGHNILTSFLGGDVGGSADVARSMRDDLRAAAERGGTRDEEYFGGEGYSITVDGNVAVLESLYDVFPSTCYPVAALVGALEQLLAWLAIHAQERPRRQR